MLSQSRKIGKTGPKVKVIVLKCNLNTQGQRDQGSSFAEVCYQTDTMCL